MVSTSPAAGRWSSSTWRPFTRSTPISPVGSPGPVVAGLPADLRPHRGIEATPALRRADESGHRGRQGQRRARWDRRGHKVVDHRAVEEHGRDPVADVVGVEREVPGQEVPDRARLGQRAEDAALEQPGEVGPKRLHRGDRHRSMRAPRRTGRHVPDGPCGRGSPGRLHTFGARHASVRRGAVLS
jgi:hypothetical protein